MQQGTKNTKELPAYIKNVAFKGPLKKWVKTKSYGPSIVCFEEENLANTVNYNSAIFIFKKAQKASVKHTTKSRGHVCLLQC